MKNNKTLNYEDRKNVDKILDILDSIFLKERPGIIRCKFCGATTIGRPHRIAEIRHLEEFPRNNPDFPYGQDLEPLSTAKINQHRMAGIEINAILNNARPGLFWELYEKQQSYLDSFMEVSSDEEIRP
jgi:hypothetical protein